MRDYYIRWSERAPGYVREIPLGIYGGHSSEAAIQRAGREWGLERDLLIAEVLPGATSARDPRPSFPSALGPSSV